MSRGTNSLSSAEPSLRLSLSEYQSLPWAPAPLWSSPTRLTLARLEAALRECWTHNCATAIFIPTALLTSKLELSRNTRTSQRLFNSGSRSAGTLDLLNRCEETTQTVLRIPSPPVATESTLSVSPRSGPSILSNTNYLALFGRPFTERCPAHRRQRPGAHGGLLKKWRIQGGVGCLNAPCSSPFKILCLRF
ncbi:hypothetical protein HDK77DRAFT_452710 [Phyllosticta capitalensis]